VGRRSDKLRSDSRGGVGVCAGSGRRAKVEDGTVSSYREIRQRREKELH
jgi:hypothetical protein